MNDSDNDDTPQLSAHALAALQEFYAEQTTKTHEEQQAMQAGEASNTGIIQEDWQLSQFWYDEQTSEVLAKEALAAAGQYGRIACVSCPTLYQKLQTMKPSTCQTTVFEFDRRFATYKEDFVFYDYNKPLQLPTEIENQCYDVVVADPPFLNEDCFAKTAETVKYLTKGKIILCTGAVMEPHAKDLLDASMCAFIYQATAINLEMTSDAILIITLNTCVIQGDISHLPLQKHRYLEETASSHYSIFHWP